MKKNLVTNRNIDINNDSLLFYLNILRVWTRPYGHIQGNMIMQAVTVENDVVFMSTV